MSSLPMVKLDVLTNNSGPLYFALLRVASPFHTAVKLGINA